MNFSNLFNGNKELGDATNKFFNENWKDILVELKPEISENIKDVYVKIINHVLSSFPYETLFE